MVELIQNVQQLTSLLLSTALVLFQLYALVDCIRRPPAAFQVTGNQTKVIWLVITGVSLALGVVRWGNGLDMFMLLGVVGAAVYLVRVKPAIQGFGGGRPRGGGSPGGW